MRSDVRPFPQQQVKPGKILLMPTLFQDEVADFFERVQVRTKSGEFLRQKYNIGESEQMYQPPEHPHRPGEMCRSVWLGTSGDSTKTPHYTVDSMLQYYDWRSQVYPMKRFCP